MEIHFVSIMLSHNDKNPIYFFELLRLRGLIIGINLPHICIVLVRANISGSSRAHRKLKFKTSNAEVIREECVTFANMKENIYHENYITHTHVYNFMAWRMSCSRNSRVQLLFIYALLNFEEAICIFLVLL